MPPATSQPQPIAPGDTWTGIKGGSLSRSVLTALEYAANVAGEDHRLGNGSTALYWHLVGVVAQHVADGAAKAERERKEAK